MSDLLIRDVDAPTKRALSIRAAQNGCSQGAEALKLLQKALADEPKSWLAVLREGAEEVGGIDIPLPPRHVPRLTGTLLS